MRNVTVTLVLGLSLIVGAMVTAPCALATETESNTVKVFVLAGQPNMEGKDNYLVRDDGFIRVHPC
jgi:hypothetical protein